MNIQDVLRFVEQAERYLAANDPQRKTKLAYALARVTKQCQPKIQDYLAELEDRRVEHCLTDKDGAIRRAGPEGKDYVFTREGLNALNAAHRELLQKEIELDPYYATVLPDELSEAWRAEFEGFVVRETIAAAA